MNVQVTILNKNIMKTTDLIKKIDFNSLRTQKGTLIKIIDDLERTGMHPDQESDLTGILNLIDALQDYAVDVMDMNPITVYDFELEENRTDVKKIKTVILCATCNSDNVLIKTNKKGLCCDCTGEHNIYQTKLKADAKIIGFQVVGTAGTDKEGRIHPDMLSSSALYSLNQARKMIKNRETENWSLLAIWTGDIEEPTIMFKGKLRTFKK